MQCKDDKPLLVTAKLKFGTKGRSFCHFSQIFIVTKCTDEDCQGKQKLGEDQIEYFVGAGRR